MINFELKGFQEFQRELKRYKGEKRRLIEKETAKAAVNVDRGAKRRAPVNKKVGAGNRLRSSIHFNINGLDAEVIAGNATTVTYAPYVEFGTGNLVSVPPELKDYAEQFRGKGIRQVNIPAQPFLYPSLVEERPKYRKRIEKALGNETI